MHPILPNVRALHSSTFDSGNRVPEKNRLAFPSKFTCTRVGKAEGDETIELPSLTGLSRTCVLHIHGPVLLMAKNTILNLPVTVL